MAILTSLHGGLNNPEIVTLSTWPHRSLARLLCTARFTRALRCAHSLNSMRVGTTDFFMSQIRAVLNHDAVLTSLPF